MCLYVWGGVGGDEGGETEGGLWGGTHSHDAPAFLLVPPLWTISSASTRSSDVLLKKLLVLAETSPAEPVSAGLLLHRVKGGLRSLKLGWVLHPHPDPAVKGKPQAPTQCQLSQQSQSDVCV